MSYFGSNRLRIFLSHDQADGSVVEDTKEGLESNGFDVYIYEGDGQPGRSLPAEVIEALEESDVVLAIQTPTSVDSQWMRDEMVWARALDIPLVPILEESLSPPGGILGDDTVIIRYRLGEEDILVKRLEALFSRYDTQTPLQEEYEHRDLFRGPGGYYTETSYSSSWDHLAQVGSLFIYHNRALHKVVLETKDWWFDKGTEEKLIPGVLYHLSNDTLAAFKKTGKKVHLSEDSFAPPASTASIFSPLRNYLKNRTTTSSTSYDPPPLLDGDSPLSIDVSGEWKTKNGLEELTTTDSLSGTACLPPTLFADGFPRVMQTTKLSSDFWLLKDDVVEILDEGAIYVLYPNGWRGYLLELKPSEDIVDIADGSILRKRTDYDIRYLASREFSPGGYISSGGEDWGQ